MADEIEITNPSSPPEKAADILYGDSIPDAADEPQDTPREPAARAPEPSDEPAGVTYTADEVSQHTALLNGRQRVEAADNAIAAKYGSANPDVLARQIVELEKTDKARAQVIRSELREYYKARQQVVQQLTTADQQLKQGITARQYDQVHRTERAKLLAAAPDLADRKVAEQFHGWLLSEGYTQEQLATSMSHRAFVHMHRLWRSQNPAPAQKPAPVVKLRMRKRAPNMPGGNSPGGVWRSPGSAVADDLYGHPRRGSSAPRRDPRLEDPVTILYGSKS